MLRQLSILPRLLQSSVFTPKPISTVFRNFSIFSQTSSCQSVMAPALLQAPQVTLNFDRGMKQMGRLKRRCKDCYFVTRQERLYVMCKTGKHKQMMMMKKPKNTWILTDATQSKFRAW